MLRWKCTVGNNKERQVRKKKQIMSWSQLYDCVKEEYSPGGEGAASAKVLGLKGTAAQVREQQLYGWHRVNEDRH